MSDWFADSRSNCSELLTDRYSHSFLDITRKFFAIDLLHIV